MRASNDGKDDSSVANLSYGFDRIGNLLNRADTYGASEQFCYDKLNRLTNYSVNSLTCRAGFGLLKSVFQGLETGGQWARIFPILSLPCAVRRLNMPPLRGVFGVTSGGRKFAGIRLYSRPTRPNLLHTVAWTKENGIDTARKMSEALKRKALRTFFKGMTPFYGGIAQLVN
jgi:hypothetical protein